jgi:tRNA nucleotidyltransferase/poly(A) polymerase
MKPTPHNPALDLLEKRTAELTQHVQEQKDGALVLEGRINRAIENEPILSWIPQFFADNPEAELYLVGGAVRDLLLEKPNKDFDFVVRGLTIEQIEEWTNKFGDANTVGRNFGVTVFSPEGFPAERYESIDIALPRLEHCDQESSGASRDVTVQSDPHMPIEDDLGRRDLTINAIAFDVRAQELIDPYHGQEDLKNKIIRTAGDPQERFREDMSRMFRAIRMGAQFDFTIEPKTWSALCAKMTEINKMEPAKNAHGKVTIQMNDKPKMQYTIPRETITREIAKALTRNPQKAAELLFASGALSELVPSAHMQREQNPNRFAALSATRTKDLTTIYALIMRGLTPKELRRSFNMINFEWETQGAATRTENKDIVELVEWIGDKGRPNKLMEQRPHAFKRQLMTTQGDRYILCLRALGHEQQAKQLEITRQAMLRNCGVEHWSEIRSLVNGTDIMHAFGFENGGPHVGELLRRALDLQLTGEGRTKEEILQKLKA